MYSDRPRRSRHNPGRARPVKKDVAEGSSSAIGPIIPDTSKFEALSLNDSSSTLDSTDGDTSSGQPDSAIMEPSADVEAVSPKSEGLRELEEYLKEHTFDSMEDAFEYLWNNQKDTLAVMYPQSSLDNYEFGSESEIAPKQEEAGSVPASEQAPSVPEQGQSSEAPYEEIAQNGKKWMMEEVMVAFNKYIEDKEDVEHFSLQK